MGQSLLDKEVTIEIYSLRSLHGESRNTDKFPAKMTIREAIKAGYLSDPVVALQIFEHLEDKV